MAQMLFSESVTLAFRSSVQCDGPIHLTRLIDQNRDRRVVLILRYQERPTLALLPTRLRYSVRYPSSMFCLRISPRRRDKNLPRCLSAGSELIQYNDCVKAYTSLSDAVTFSTKRQAVHPTISVAWTKLRHGMRVAQGVLGPRPKRELSMIATSAKLS